LTPQILATDLYCGHGIQPFSTSIAASATKVVIGYMTHGPSNGCGGGTGPHGVRAQMYDYESSTKNWTLSPLIDTVSPFCCDGHDAPGTFRHPVTGRFTLVYGAIDSGASGDGPYVNVATTADSISAWSGRGRAGTPGAFSEPRGGYDSNNVLHLVGQHQVHSPNGMDYARQFTNGTWDSVKLITCGSCSNVQGPPFSPALAVRGSVLHLAWANTTDGWSSGRDVFYAKSTDGGNTWCNAAGASCVSRSSGLVGTFNSGAGRYQWPDYSVVTGLSGVIIANDAFSDQTPLVAVRSSSGSRLYRWNGSSWSSHTIDSGATDTYGIAIAVTSTNKVLVYGPDANAVNMNEWASTNCPSTCTFSKTVLYSAGEAVKRFPNVTRFANLGGKERVWVQWVEGNNSEPNLLGVIDRPQ
jgi:hypothetical protein